MTQVVQVEPKQILERLRHSIVEATTFEQFGQSIVRRALVETAGLLEAGKIKGLSADIPIRLSVRIGYEPPPVEQFKQDPMSLNLDYEICATLENGSFLSCYIARTAPRPPALLRHGG